MAHMIHRTISEPSKVLKSVTSLCCVQLSATGLLISRPIRAKITAPVERLIACHHITSFTVKSVEHIAAICLISGHAAGLLCFPQLIDSLGDNMTVPAYVQRFVSKIRSRQAREATEAAGITLAVRITISVQRNHITSSRDALTQPGNEVPFVGIMIRERAAVLAWHPQTIERPQPMLKAIQPNALLDFAC
ncbi:hypothetical protein CBL_02749 [Carabus blaptoides fortunei]